MMLWEGGATLAGDEGGFFGGIPAAMHSFGEVILNMCNLDVKSTWYIRYTTLSVSLFRIFRFEISDQLAVIVFCRSSQTPATILAAIEPACYTSLKIMKLRDFTPQIAVSPTARGCCRAPVPEVGHRCTGRRKKATPPSWSSSSPQAPLWMLWTMKARGPQKRSVGTTRGAE